MSKNITKKLQKFMEENNISESDIRNEIDSKKRIKNHEKMKKETEKNKKFIGKCYVATTNDKLLGLSFEPNEKLFPTQKIYIKIISNIASSIYKVQCLTFTEHPVYWFDYQAHKMFHEGDYFLGHFKFESFEIKEILTTNINSLTEISNEEFEKQMLK